MLALWRWRTVACITRRNQIWWDESGGRVSGTGSGRGRGAVLNRRKRIQKLNRLK